MQRLTLYVIIFGVRYFILYIVFTQIQTYANEMIMESTAATDCWYSAISKTGCKEVFDFSDHVVYYYANFIVPVVIELSWSIYTKRALTAMELQQSKATGHGLLPIVPWIRYTPALLVSLVVWICASRNMMFTALYMHTPAECIAALLILLITVIIPLYIYTDKISARITSHMQDQSHKHYAKT